MPLQACNITPPSLRHALRMPAMCPYTANKPSQLEGCLQYDFTAKSWQMRSASLRD